MLKSCAGLSAVWLAEHAADVLAAQAHAHHAAQSQAPSRLEFLNPQQAADVEAIAAQIIPSDETPGAREARAIYFIDRALATFAADDRASFVEGLKQLNKKSSKRFGKAKRFSDLNSEQQTKLLKDIEKTPFFDLARTITILGTFSNPEYGGNYDKIGWKLLGFEDQFFFKSPYGFYDIGYKSK